MNDRSSTTDGHPEEARSTSRLPGTAASNDADIPNPTELQYHLFVERVRDYAIFLMDPNGIISHWGEGATRMKEFTPEEVVGKHLGMLYPPGGAEDGKPEDHIRIAKETGEYVGEGMRLAGRRGLFPARVTLTALRRDGRLIGFSKVTQDMTEQRRVEARLQEALRAAESANAEKSRFLATMSHEIRTPINAVLGYADLLHLGISGTLNEAQRGYVERIRASGSHLLTLIEDVLDFARVEAGRMDVHAEQHPAADAVEAALGLIRPQAAAAGLEVEVACGADVTYWADERRVRQVLVNLLGNAIKFTPAGGRIRVTCGRARPAPDAVLPERGEDAWTFIRVEDSGIGIAAEQMGTVFEPFVQVDSALTRVHQGSGLGLAISRRLARLMGGDLTVRSREGQGSAFSLWLHADAPAPDVRADETGRVPGASLTRVGHHLSVNAPPIVRAYTERLRVDPVTPAARTRTRSELEDHMGTLLTDLAQTLVLVEEDGPDAPETAHDGSDVQRLLAERHGRQRRRLGWSEEGLRRDYEIIREEVETVLLAAHEVATEDALREALPIIQRLLGRAANISLEAYRTAGGDGP
ncbi:PAS domain-containing sensor histidine kinase [Longimicrobium sp.]|uniref:sensor histidine kinase n=1 Tax=Longimicrobium sp. TaxID=2029185 RepID=UPI002E323C42|nr:ATP-binding protein [Longimicrobium sp.]HEX6037502.1 ATP-binding protein [Longimicrobium sp.]